MPHNAAPVLVLPKSVQGWQPMTFLERGVAVPFTTPHLAGARLRRAERGGLEVIVPEVAGPGSVGILVWERVGALCSPTVFDRRLAARLAALPSLTPASVREAVCAEAAEGLAGPEAQEAATRARQADMTERQHALAVLLDHAPGLSRTPALAHIAALLGPVGLGRGAETARLPRTLAGVVALAEQVSDRPCTVAGGVDAEVVVAAAQRVASAAVAALVAGRELAADPPALLRRWVAAPAAVAAELGRADWLLDGWAWLCRLFALREEHSGRAALVLAELAALLPLLPREAGPLAPVVRRQEPPTPLHALLRTGDWRSGVTAQDLVARNERLLAGTLMLPEGTA
jgi:hypothetical protein